jgi:hypothetical protein
MSLWARSMLVSQECLRRRGLAHLVGIAGIGRGSGAAVRTGRFVLCDRGQLDDYSASFDADIADRVLVVTQVFLAYPPFGRELQTTEPR